MTARFRLLAAASVLAALGGCTATATAPPGAVRGAAQAPTQGPTPVAVSTEQGGRFVGLAGPRRQHAEPFLGVAGTNFHALRSWIDTRNGQTVHQLYVSDSYAGPARDWYAARDAQGRPLRFVPIGKNEITCQPSCSYAEEFAAAIPEPQLRENAGGLTVTFAARSGAEKTVAVPAEFVRAQLVAADRVRAGLATATASAAPAPPRP